MCVLGFPSMASEPLQAPAPVEESVLLQRQPPGSARATHFRYVILTMVFFAITINTIDRMVLGILAPRLQALYSISDSTYGWIVGSFSFIYALGQLGAGAWLDRIGIGLGYAISLSAWSVAAALHALARGALGFGIMRGLLGISESPAFPAAAKTLAEWFPRRERALAMGVVNAGTNLGAVTAPIIVPWLALNYGWQWAFIGTASLGFIWMLFWIPIYRRPEKHPKVSAQELAYINSDPAEPTTKIPWLTLLKYRQTWAFAIGKFLSDPIWYFYLTFVPKFLNKQYQVDLKAAILPLVLVYGMADLGAITGGWISSRMIARGYSVNQARKTGLFVSALWVTPIVFITGVHNKWLAVFLLGLGTAAHQGFSSNIYTIVSDMFPRRAVGSVAGLGGTCGYLGSTLFAVFAGYTLKWTHENYTVLFAIAGCAYLVGFAAIHALAPRLKPAIIE